MEHTEKREKYSIPLSEPISDIAVGAVIMTVMLCCSGLFALVTPNERVTLFNVPVAGRIWFVFVGQFVLSCLKNGVKIGDRRYTTGLAFMTLITNVLSFALTFYALLVAGLLNAEFFRALIDLTGEIPLVTWIFRNMPLFITVCTGFGMIVDIIVCFIKAAGRAAYEAGGA